MMEPKCNWSVRIFILAVMLCSLSRLGWSEEPEVGRTPPMGWNSWNNFQCKVSAAIVRAQADILVSTGMKAAGYVYVNVDDCWQGQRDAQGNIKGNERFPDMKALGDYIHSKGLKFGIYSSPGPKTCAGYEGSLGHEERDARTYAAWGVDYLKYDKCYLTGDVQDQLAAWTKMHEALHKTGRPIFYSLAQSGVDRIWTWGPSVGANSWRTNEDIGYAYASIAPIGFGQNGLERFAGPGHWNDPDTVQIGDGRRLNAEEARTHMSLWCLLAAPLLVASDLTKMIPEALAILTNPEVIAVDQDAAGIQGRRVAQEGPLEVWVKPLADGSKAVGLFNRPGGGEMPITASFRDIGVGDTAAIRDLWARKDLGVFKQSYMAMVAPHGVVMLKVK